MCTVRCGGIRSRVSIVIFGSEIVCLIRILWHWATEARDSWSMVDGFICCSKKYFPLLLAAAAGYCCCCCWWCCWCCWVLVLLLLLLLAHHHHHHHYTNHSQSASQPTIHPYSLQQSTVWVATYEKIKIKCFSISALESTFFQSRCSFIIIIIIITCIKHF